MGLATVGWRLSASRSSGAACRRGERRGCKRRIAGDIGLREACATATSARAASLAVCRRIQNLRESPARSMATNGDERRVVAITTIVDENCRRWPRLALRSAAASQPLLQRARVLLSTRSSCASVARRCSTSFSIASTRVCESGVNICIWRQTRSIGGSSSMAIGRTVSMTELIKRASGRSFALVAIVCCVNCCSVASSLSRSRNASCCRFIIVACALHAAIFTARTLSTVR